MHAFNILIILHLTCVALTVSLFALRYWWHWSTNPRFNARWVRVTPHIVDTLLLLSGAGLMWVTGYLPFTAKGAWLTEKLFGVIIYIVLGFMRSGDIVRAASKGVLSLFCWGWWCCTSSLNSPPQKYRYWGKT